MLVYLDRPERRLVLRWLLLVALTLTSWESINHVGWLTDARLPATAAIVLAFIKVRIVVLDFMEVRHAPIGLRVALETWVIVACGSILAMYWLPGLVRTVGP